MDNRGDVPGWRKRPYPSEGYRDDYDRGYGPPYGDDPYRSRMREDYRDPRDYRYDHGPPSFEDPAYRGMGPPPPHYRRPDPRDEYDRVRDPYDPRFMDRGADLYRREPYPYGYDERPRPGSELYDLPSESLAGTDMTQSMRGRGRGTIQRGRGGMGGHASTLGQNEDQGSAAEGREQMSVSGEALELSSESLNGRGKGRIRGRGRGSGVGLTHSHERGLALHYSEPPKIPSLMDSEPYEKVLPKKSSSLGFEPPYDRQQPRGPPFEPHPSDRIPPSRTGPDSEPYPYDRIPSRVPPMLHSARSDPYDRIPPRRPPLYDPGPYAYDRISSSRLGPYVDDPYLRDERREQVGLGPLPRDNEPYDPYRRERYLRDDRLRDVAEIGPPLTDLVSQLKEEVGVGLNEDEWYLENLLRKNEKEFGSVDDDRNIDLGRRESSDRDRRGSSDRDYDRGYDDDLHVLPRSKLKAEKRRQYIYGRAEREPPRQPRIPTWTEIKEELSQKEEEEIIGHTKSAKKKRRKKAMQALEDPRFIEKQEMIDCLKQHLAVMRYSRYEQELLQNSVDQSRVPLNLDYKCEELIFFNGQMIYTGTIHLSDIFIIRVISADKKNCKDQAYAKAYSTLRSKTPLEICSKVDSGLPAIRDDLFGSINKDTDIHEAIKQVRDAMDRQDKKATAQEEKVLGYKRLINFVKIRKDQVDYSGIIGRGIRVAKCNVKENYFEGQIPMPTLGRIIYRGVLYFDDIIVGKAAGFKKKDTKMDAYQDAFKRMLEEPVEEIMKGLPADKDEDLTLEKLIEMAEHKKGLGIESKLPQFLANIREMDWCDQGVSHIDMRAIACHFTPTVLYRKVDKDGESSYICELYVDDLHIGTGEAPVRPTAHMEAYNDAVKIMKSSTTDQLIETRKRLTKEMKEAPDVIEVVEKGTNSKRIIENNLKALKKNTFGGDFNTDIDNMVMFERADQAFCRKKFAFLSLIYSATKNNVLFQWEVTPNASKFRCEAKFADKVVGTGYSISRLSAKNVAAIDALYKFFKTHPFVQVCRTDDSKFWIPYKDILEKAKALKIAAGEIEEDPATSKKDQLSELNSNNQGKEQEIDKLIQEIEHPTTESEMKGQAKEDDSDTVKTKYSQLVGNGKSTTEHPSPEPSTSKQEVENKEHPSSELDTGKQELDDNMSVCSMDLDMENMEEDSSAEDKMDEKGTDKLQIQGFLTESRKADKWVTKVVEEIIRKFMETETLEELLFGPGFSLQETVCISQMAQHNGLRINRRKSMYPGTQGQEYLCLHRYHTAQQILNVLKKCGGTSGKFRIMPPEEKPKHEAVVKYMKENKTSFSFTPEIWAATSTNIHDGKKVKLNFARQFTEFVDHPDEYPTTDNEMLDLIV